MADDNKGFGALVSSLSQTNIELWGEEDKARVGNDLQTAAAKRKIDQLNQKRNDLIEKIDEYFLKQVKGEGKRG